MSYEIPMPRLGWNMEEGMLVQWMKKDGELVKQGEIVCVIEGDKATTEIESFESGVLKIPHDSPEIGQLVPVGTILGYILSENDIDSFQSNLQQKTQADQNNSPEQPEDSTQVDSVIDRPIGITNRKDTIASTTPRSKEEKQNISPRALRLAKEATIDWSSLQGSGKTGRIVEKDIQRAIDNRVNTKSCVTEPQLSSTENRRSVIAQRMVDSHQKSAPITLNTEVDVTTLSSFFTHSTQPSWYALMAKISALGLIKYPSMNASWQDGVVMNEGIHIGIAVDTPEGVVVPVIRDVPTISLQKMSQTAKQLIDLSKTGKLNFAKLEGGTFTLTNLGMYDIDAFTPMINLPQCAILGIGRVAPKPVVINESSASIGIRKLMTLSLTFDHRIVDGAPAARFLQEIKYLAENPDKVFQVNEISVKSN